MNITPDKWLEILFSTPSVPENEAALDALTATAKTTVKVCRKCNGTGYTAHWHVANGVCFRCGGTGKG